LKDFIIIFSLAVFVMILFHKIQVSTIVAFLVAGIVAGLHFLKPITNLHDIEFIFRNKNYFFAVYRRN
jgi:CPA2 family monovalent cation:H+ antiporter-2